MPWIVEFILEGAIQERAVDGIVNIRTHICRYGRISRLLCWFAVPFFVRVRYTCSISVSLSPYRYYIPPDWFSFFPFYYFYFPSQPESLVGRQLKPHLPVPILLEKCDMSDVESAI